MQIRCSNCAHIGQETMSDVGACNCCENFEFFSPYPPKQGQPYLVRVSELRYGEVTVWAASEDEAKTIASGVEINFYDAEITDMAAEPVEKGEAYET